MLWSKKKIYKKKSRSQLSQQFAGKLFQAPKIQIPQSDRPEVVVIWAPFEKQKAKVHIFDRANIEIFQKKKQGILGHTFLKTPPAFSGFITLPLEVPDKTKLHPQKLHKIITPPGNFKA